MPDSTMDEVYSTPQINIPPTFPFILKQYAKAALRTQPYDLLRWSASYFRALAKGEEPPIKDRLEYPPPDTPSGLSPGYLKVLIKQIGKGGTVTLSELVDRWNGICLAEEPLLEMLAVGQFGDSFDWLHFVAVAAGFLSNNLTQTMVLLCNLLTDEPDGGSAIIPLHTFAKLYTFLASLDCGEPNDQEDGNENHHEYIMTEGLRDDISLYSHDSASLKRESVESCVTDPSIYQVNWGSDSAHELFVETHSPFPSPLSSRPCTPRITMENASTTTLTPLNQHCISEEQEIVGEAHLETFYDAKVKEKGSGSGSLHSSQELMEEGKDNEDTEEGRCCVKSSTSVPSTPVTATTTLKCKSSNSHGDVDEKAPATSTTLSSQKSMTKNKRSLDKRALERQYVPGIGAAVDAVQVQAVIDYLEGVGLKQEGMVKPSNIRHFLCPPLEKVPASQKTRV